MITPPEGESPFAMFPPSHELLPEPTEEEFKNMQVAPTAKTVLTYHAKPEDLQRFVVVFGCLYELIDGGHCIARNDTLYFRIRNRIVRHFLVKKKAKAMRLPVQFKREYNLANHSLAARKVRMKGKLRIQVNNDKGWEFIKEAEVIKPNYAVLGKLYETGSEKELEAVFQMVNKAIQDKIYHRPYLFDCKQDIWEAFK